MNLKQKFFKNFNVYAVTDITRYTPDLVTQIDKAYRGGAGIVQLRAKTLTDKEFLRLALKIREIARHHGRGFVVNDRVDLALSASADAVHVGQEDMPIEYIRDLIDRRQTPMLIGKSTHSLEQAMEAQAEGADYIGVGPIFTTPTKPDYPAVGVELIHQIKRKITLPFVAIGGIHPGNLASVYEAGAPCAAVVRAIFAQDNIYEAAKKLKEIYAHYEVHSL